MMKIKSVFVKKITKIQVSKFVKGKLRSVIIHVKKMSVKGKMNGLVQFARKIESSIIEKQII